MSLNETMWAGKGGKYECIIGQNGRNDALWEGCIAKIGNRKSYTWNILWENCDDANIQAILYTKVFQLCYDIMFLFPGNNRSNLFYTFTF